MASRRANVGPVEVKIKGDASLKKKITPGLYRPVMQKMFGDLSKVGVRAAKRKVPVDTGALKSSIQATVKTTGVTIRSPLDYAKVVELGRSKGSKPPPVRALSGWLSRHGIPLSAAYAVANAIGRRGIKGRFFMKAGMSAMQKKLPYDLKKAERQVAKKFGKKVTSG